MPQARWSQPHQLSLIPTRFWARFPAAQAYSVHRRDFNSRIKNHHSNSAPGMFLCGPKECVKVQETSQIYATNTPPLGQTFPAFGTRV